MKVAVVMATFNKERELPNTLYALNRQETTLDVEVCIADDCSAIDPKPIIDKYLTKFPVKYKRLDEHVGVIFSHPEAFNLVSDDVEVILQPSSDVIMAMPNMLHDLCTAVEDGMPTFAEVLDIDLSPSIHEYWDKNIPGILKNWEKFPRSIDIQMNGRTYRNCSTLYSGRPNCSWLFFMGAMRKADFEAIGFNYFSCDAFMHQTMRELGFRAKLMPWLKGIHQRHPKEMYKCGIIEHCPYWCIQKDWAKE